MKCECGSAEADGDGEIATLTASLCISSLFVYFLSGVNIYAWLQPSHLHMSRPTNILSARTHTFRSTPALIVRLSQYSPSSQILTYFFA